MKHYIIAKWNEGVDKEAQLAPVRDIFEGVLTVPGVHGVKVKPCCIARANRYDLMIEIDMDKEALSTYDGCAAHKQWKENYGSMLSAKVIFDSED